MRSRLSVLLASVFLLSLSGFAQAVIEPQRHVIVAPKCLVERALLSHIPMAETGQFVLLNLNDAAIDKLITARNEQIEFMLSCGGFHDVTQSFIAFDAGAQSFLMQHVRPKKAMLQFEPPYVAHYPKHVQKLLMSINPQNMWTDLTKLTSFKDRYANSSAGIKAASWIQDTVSAMAMGRDDVSVYTIPTSGYKQPSVILKLGTGAEPGVVISGHMDTVSGWWVFHMPGADDDGSGSVTVLETARTILNSHMQFKKPIYFVWYAAEEEGLVGSGSVVNMFHDKKILVEAALHFDMTGFEFQNDPTMWLLEDYTDPKMTQWLATLIKTYVKQKVNFTRCGYDCSDHASWTRVGVPAGAATETRFEDMNTSLHTTEDKMEKLSLRHMADYLKLAVSFAVETAEPIDQ